MHTTNLDLYATNDLVIEDLPEGSAPFGCFGTASTAACAVSTTSSVSSFSCAS